MFLKLKVPVSSKELLFSLLLYYTFKFQKSAGYAFSYKVNHTKKLLITIPKGPFAHKKSKEQFYLVRTFLRITVRQPIIIGLLPTVVVSKGVNSDITHTTHIYY